MISKNLETHQWCWMVMIQQMYLFTQHKILIRSGFWTLGARFMSPNYEWFQTFKEIDGGIVLLDNNKVCKIQGI